MCRPDSHITSGSPSLTCNQRQWWAAPGTLHCPWRGAGLSLPCSHTYAMLALVQELTWSVHWLLPQPAQHTVQVNKAKGCQRHLLTQLVYWSYRALKKIIQFPSVLRVSGASRRQIPGICPLKRAWATSSSSLLIPTSPAKAWNKGRVLRAGKAQLVPGSFWDFTHTLELSQGPSHPNDEFIKTFQFLQQHHSRGGNV